MNKKPTNTSQVRILKIINCLKGHAIDGLSNTDIATMIKDSKANVSRTLDVMIAEGFAVKHEETGRFSLSKKMISIATSTMLELDKAEAKINEIRQRIIAGAQQ